MQAALWGWILCKYGDTMLNALRDPASSPASSYALISVLELVLEQQWQLLKVSINTATALKHGDMS